MGFSTASGFTFGGREAFFFKLYCSLWWMNQRSRERYSAFSIFSAPATVWWIGLLIPWYWDMFYGSLDTGVSCNLWFIHIQWTLLCLDFFWGLHWRTTFLVPICSTEDSSNSWYLVNWTWAFKMRYWLFFVQTKIKLYFQILNSSFFFLFPFFPPF